MCIPCRVSPLASHHDDVQIVVCHAVEESGEDECVAWMRACDDKEGQFRSSLLR